VTSFPNSTTIVTGTPRSGTAGSLSADDGSYFEVGSTTSGTRTTAWYGTFTGVPNSLGGLKVTYVGKNSRGCTQTIAIWRWSDDTWVQLDSRSVGDVDVSIADLVPPGTLGDYVSGTSGAGELRVQVRCTRSKQSFIAGGDLMQIVHEAP
jgi:hypothetical protein